MLEGVPGSNCAVFESRVAGALWIVGVGRLALVLGYGLVLGWMRVVHQGGFGVSPRLAARWHGCSMVYKW